jgi:glutaredoxin 3
MIQIYTKNYCPYCTQAKSLLDSLDVKYEEIDITSTPETIEELVAKSGLRTVPQIFVGDKCLGGYSDIAKLHEEGKLVDLLKEES